MIVWIIVLFILSLILGFFAFMSTHAGIALLAKIGFLTFTVLFAVALFVYIGTKNKIR